MDIKNASIDTLLIVASNLTLAEINSTHLSEKPIPSSSMDKKPEAFVIEIFDRHLGRLLTQQGK